MIALEFVFAVDGGGSKTVAELRRRDGSVVARFRGGPCNLYQDSGAGISVIRDGWLSCAGQVAIAPELLAARTCFSVGLAGISLVGVRALVHAAFPGFAARLVSGDGYAALVGAFGAQPGAVLSIGTGSVGCRFEASGRFVQVGGWGFPAGDRGGGAWIGRKLVGDWLDRRDALIDVAAWRFLESRLGSSRDQILAWLRAATPSDYAGLVPDLLQAERAGDSDAILLLDAAAAHLARLARSLLAGLDLDLALAGGLSAALAPRLTARLGPQVRVSVGRQASALEGAWRIGLGDRPAQFSSD